MPFRVFFPVFVFAVALAGAAKAQWPPRDAVVRLQRTSCFGPCPVYTITVDAFGTVTYEGERFVRVTGRHTAQISPQAVWGLLQRAERIRFFEMKDVYTANVSDQSTTFVTVTANGRTKRVKDYYNAPDALREFEREIDDVTSSKRWIFLSDESLEELVGSGWSAASDEGAGFLQQAIRRDDVSIAQKLMALGAALNGPPENPWPSLSSARSSAMVELLVRAGADPNARSDGGSDTPLKSARWVDPAVTRALLKAGARVDEDLNTERTALWYAACGGKWRVVSLLLEAGANPRGSMTMSAAECVRREREATLHRHRTAADHLLPTVDDFDRVLRLLESADAARPEAAQQSESLR